MFEPKTDVLRLAEPVPTSALATPNGKPGLTGQYWSNATFAGDPALTRIDSRVMFERNAPAALPGVAATSIRWTGLVVAPSDGSYRIGIDGRNAKLWIDDKLVADNTNPQQRGPNLVTMTLHAGVRHAVRIEQENGRFPPRLVWNEVRADALARAVAAARDADVVIGVVGITSSLEGEEMTVNLPGFIGGDRGSLDLPRAEEELLKAVKATGTPLVAVLMNGSALSVNWVAANADAIVDAWYPGRKVAPQSRRRSRGRAIHRGGCPSPSTRARLNCRRSANMAWRGGPIATLPVCRSTRSATASATRVFPMRRSPSANPL